MPAGKSYTEQNKGQTLLVVAGKYDGRKGWIHNGCVQPKKMVYVILSAFEDQPEVSCCIRRTSMREVSFDEQPRTMTAALLKEHTHIAVDMQLLAESLAEFDGIDPNTEFMEVFWNMWKEAKEKRSREQVRRVPTLNLWQPLHANPTRINNSAANTPAPTNTANTNEDIAAPNGGPHVIPNIPDGW